ncbi:MAG: Rrf2 family transcriptional regulator [Vicingus serpentipes]|nr:Rrf2 family transcriptional regulator [Vicingus serpentipes]
MLSKSCVYALRAIIFIAHNAREEAKIGIKEIAQELDLPVHYLGKILQQLTKHKIIQSIKGPNGGFYLDRESKQVRLIKVIEVMDGLDVFFQCGLGLNNCSEEHPCPLHDNFKVYRDGLYTLFSTTSIADLANKIDEGNAFIQNFPSKLKDSLK